MSDSLREALEAAEALGRSVEAPAIEPEYVYRARSERIAWYHRDSEAEARADLPNVDSDGWVERCLKDPWERLP